MSDLLKGLSYPFIIDSKLSGDFFNKTLPLKKYEKVILLADANTAELCVPKLRKVLGVKPADVIVLPPGDEHKHLDSVQFIWNRLVEVEANRKCVLINVGGGVITDVGGFAASCYHRGIDFIHVPTSLLAMVDASIGGKTGINFLGYKNTVGQFADPKGVYVATEFLSTLPERELRNGMAEVVKHALLGGGGLWGFIRTKPDWKRIDWPRLVADSVEYKWRVVKRDYQDKGFRHRLNAGHTVGHALEAWSHETDMPYHHGEAVAIGLIMEGRIARQQGKMSKRMLNQMTSVIRHFFPTLEFLPYSLDDLEPWMNLDKKRSDAQHQFVFIRKPGRVLTGQSATRKEVEMAFDLTQSLFAQK